MGTEEGRKKLPGIEAKYLPRSMERMEFWEGKRVVITGGTGFLGSHLVAKLREYSPKEIVTFSSKEYDLGDLESARKVISGDIVVHLAANVGGIGYNMNYPVELFKDNMIMGMNVLQVANEAKVKKVVITGTVCAYPKNTPVPFKEEDLWMGYPEETNAPYGLAKKMLLVLGDAYRNQYGLESIYLLPVNLYGPGDNFDPESSHVIPALIKKFVDAKESRKDEVVVWGTGSATREFLYVEDAAEAILLAAQFYDDSDPINVGSSCEISIRELAGKIKNLVGFTGRIAWDTSKPDGQPRRKLDTSKAAEKFGFISSTSFDEGLAKTIHWYIQNRS